MEYNIPTRERLIGRILADVENSLRTGATFLTSTFEYVFSTAFGGAVYGLYRFSDYVIRQIFTDTCSDTNLLRHAESVGIYPTAATRAEFDVLITGTVANTVIPVETVLSHQSGIVYRTTAEYTLPSAGTLERVARVRCETSGTAGNRVAGDILTITPAIAGIVSECVVQGTGIVGSGINAEDIDTFRARFRAYQKSPPRSGASGDWVTWARNAGATRAWEIRNHMGYGTMLVLIMFDNIDDDGAFVDDGFPAPEQIDLVAAELDKVSPATATFEVGAPTPVELDPVIRLDPNTEDVRNAVTQELRGVLFRSGAVGQTFALSQLSEAISLAPGEIRHSIENYSTDIELGSTELLVLGTPTFEDY